MPRKGAGSHDAYAGWGYGGQLLIVVPDLELIAVFTGWNIYDKPLARAGRGTGARPRGGQGPALRPRATNR